MGQVGATMWFTGLSGSGKSTVAVALEEALVKLGNHVYRLDGDNIRYGLSSDLGFKPSDRTENIRRIGEVAKLMCDAGELVLTSFISPYRKDRDLARKLHTAQSLKFIEVHVDIPLAEAEKRDPKGLYKKARAGQIKGMTGLDAPFEAPLTPEVVLRTDLLSVPQSVAKMLRYMRKEGVIWDRKADLPKCPKCACKKCPPAVACKASPKCPDKAKALPATGGKIQFPTVPDGGVLVNLVVPEAQRAAKVAEAAALPKLAINEVDYQWLHVMADGWASPLSGFMSEAQFLQSLHFNSLQLPDGAVCSMSLPITLALTGAQKKALAGKGAIALTYKGKDVAIMKAPEYYPHVKEERIARTWGTAADIPYVKMIRAMGDWLVGGELEVLAPIKYNDGLDEFRLSPAQLRKMFADRKADAVIAFQLRNPVHNGHALLMTSSVENLKKEGYKNPMLLLHPLGGWTKADDIPLAVRIKQHKAVLAEHALDPQNTIVGIWPSPMMYAGPTEVQWHAKSRIQAGVTHYIVGRDPAGMKHPDGYDLYESTHGAKLLRMTPGLSNKMKIVPFQVAKYDKKAGKMAFYDPSRPDDFTSISGTKMRKFGADGKDPPAGFMAPSAWTVVKEFYQQKKAAEAAKAKVWSVGSQGLGGKSNAIGTDDFDASLISKTAKGKFGTTGYTMSFSYDDNPISPWHDIPLRAPDAEDGTKLYNFVAEIPRGTAEKMEINKGVGSNPIMQDVKKGVVRSYKYSASLVNYGAFPQTWEDPEHKFLQTKQTGDNDPVDVVDVSAALAKCGGVYPVKILGALSLVDDGETDWKVVVLQAADPSADNINSLRDLKKVSPGKLEKIIKWFKMYKTAEGNGENKYAGAPIERAAAEAVVEVTSKSWQKLKAGKRVVRP